MALKPMSSPEIRAVFFDAAGTLFRLRESVGEGYQRVALRHGWKLYPKQTDAAFKQAWKSMPPMGSPLGKEADRSEKTWWRALVHQVLAEVAPIMQEDDCEELFEDLFAEYAKPEVWQLFPETKKVLTALRKLPLRLFVLSNFDSRLLPVLRGLGISGDFEQIFYSGEIGYAKPSPEIFSYALASTKLAAEECLHVGDDPVADWLGAADAGMQTVELDRKQRDLSLILELENLPDFSD